MASGPSDEGEGILRDPHGLDEEDLEGASSRSLVHAVQRAMRVVRCFDAAHAEWTIAELIRHSGLRRTTAIRLIKTLEAEGFICLSANTGKYSLGPSVFQMAYVWISEASLGRIAIPRLERLSEVIGESVGLTVWNGEGPLCVAHSPSPRPFKFLMYVGQTFTDLANAHSKVLLAFGPEARRIQCLSRRLEPLTPFTITDPERLGEELKRVEREGVAYDIQEQQLGVCAIGVPVYDFTNEVRASLTLVVSEVRYGPAEARGYVQALKQVAAALSYDLGYRGDQNLIQLAPVAERSGVE